MKWLAIILAIPSLALAQPAPQPVGPHNRAEAVKIIAGLREIVSPAGLQSIETIEIGGIRQAVSIRSQDLRNPVIIYLHGGPGFVEMPLDWWWDRGWDEYFTVVQWDQRNAGKTFTASGPNHPALLTPERFQRDAEEVVQWARRRFGKRKVFVLGHSWGSVLGLRLAAAHPDWLYAYIGMGQVTDGPESERRGWAWTMARAKEAKDAQAIRELQSIAPYAAGSQPVPVDAICSSASGSIAMAAKHGDAPAAILRRRRLRWRRNIATMTFETLSRASRPSRRRCYPKFSPPICT